MNTYEKKYNYVLKHAKALKECSLSPRIKDWVDSVFPELKESEDEKIRKDIKRAISVALDYSYFDKKTANNCLAWLENQGKEECALKSSKDEDVRKFMQYIEKEAKAYEFNLPNRGYDIYAFAKDVLIWFEKQRGKKPIDKVEPKFKVGDWITNGRYNKLIVGINSDWPYYIFEDGTSQHIKYVDKKYHLWNINDAKDGDVLVYGDNPADHHLRIIMLFKSMRTFNSVRNHFHIFADEFRINDWCDCGKTAHPATKGQRNLLFQKMKEAGYEFDFEKKELKKIEKQAPKQKWTEEDDYNVQCCIAKAEKDIKNGYPGRNQELIEWLKSLNQRIGG